MLCIKEEGRQTHIKARIIHNPKTPSLKIRGRLAPPKVKDLLLVTPVDTAPALRKDRRVKNCRHRMMAMVTSRRMLMTLMTAAEKKDGRVLERVGRVGCGTCGFEAELTSEDRGPINQGSIVNSL